MLCDNSHDVAFVYMVRKKIIEVIKVTLPNIKNIEYFTDGCTVLYGNYKKIANLCNHSMQNRISLQRIMVNNRVMA